MGMKFNVLHALYYSEEKAKVSAGSREIEFLQFPRLAVFYSVNLILLI
jgi:hypothetical protein